MPKKQAEIVDAKGSCPSCHSNEHVRTFEDGSCECLRCHFGFTP